MTTPTVILIGRHRETSIPGVMIKRQENIEWPLSVAECCQRLWELRDAALSERVTGLLLQNTPTILTSALWQLGMGDGAAFGCWLGLVVNTPSTRVEGKLATYAFHHIEWLVKYPALTSIDPEPDDAIRTEQAVLLGMASFNGGLIPNWFLRVPGENRRKAVLQLVEQGLLAINPAGAALTEKGLEVVVLSLPNGR